MSLAAFGLGIRMALEDYPGYGLVRRLRDGEGLEKIVAGKLRLFADWLAPTQKRDREIEQTREYLSEKLKARPATNEIQEPSQRPRIDYPVLKEVRVTIHPPKPNVAPSLARLCYTGEKKGKMRTLVKATMRWIEFSALAPEVLMTEEEAEWLLSHRKDFMRRQ